MRYSAKIGRRRSVDEYCCTKCKQTLMQLPSTDRRRKMWLSPCVVPELRCICKPAASRRSRPACSVGHRLRMHPFQTVAANRGITSASPPRRGYNSRSGSRGRDRVRRSAASAWSTLGGQPGNYRVQIRLFRLIQARRAFAVVGGKIDASCSPTSGSNDRTLRHRDLRLSRDLGHMMSHSLHDRELHIGVSNCHCYS